MKNNELSLDLEQALLLIHRLAKVVGDLQDQVQFLIDRMPLHHKVEFEKIIIRGVMERQKP